MCLCFVKICLVASIPPIIQCHIVPENVLYLVAFKPSEKFGSVP
jgi:hypothetical protein